MRTALIIGNGQIGSEVATQLAEAGVAVRIATRSGGGTSGAALSNDAASGTVSDTHPNGTLHAQSTHTSSGPTTVCTPVQVKADASDRAQLAEAAAGVDVIFACAHAPPTTVGGGSRSSPGSMRRSSTPLTSSTFPSSSRNRSMPSRDCAPRSPKPPRSPRSRTRGASGSGSLRLAQLIRRRLPVSSPVICSAGPRRSGRRSCGCASPSRSPTGAGPWCRHARMCPMASQSSPIMPPQ